MSASLDRRPAGRVRGGRQAVVAAFGWRLVVALVALAVTPPLAAAGSGVVPAMTAATYPPGAEHAGAGALLPLAAHLALDLVLLLAAVTLLDLVAGGPARRPRVFLLVGATGWIVFLGTMLTIGGAAWEWDVTPAGIALGYLVDHVLRRRDAGRPR